MYTQIKYVVLSEFRYYLNSDIMSYMCGATHPRNSHGVGKVGSILLDYHINFISHIMRAYSPMMLGRMMLGGLVSLIFYLCSVIFNWVRYLKES